MNQVSKRFFQFQQRFSIRKFKVGVASVAISSMAVGLSLTPLTAVYAQEGGFNRTETGTSGKVDSPEFVMVTHEKPGGVVEDVAILKSKFSENLDQLKKDYPGFTATSLQSIGNNKYKITYVPVTTTNQPSSTTENAANTGDTGTSNSTSATANQTQPTTENKVSLQGHLVEKQAEYNVGEQIISTFRLDVSAPSKLEEGSYILVNLPTNEPITDVQFGTALKVEKVNETQYKIYTGEVPSGSYGNFNISYKFDKYRTGRNSQTSITSQVMDKNGNPISPEKTTKSVVTNTNKSGYASIHVDSESGARELALFNTNAPGDTIDETKNKELVLKLTTLNKEVAAVNKIQHAVTLPTGAVVSETSINAGWTQEGNIARYTRTIPDAKTVFDQGNNTSDDTLRINMRQAGTLEEFLKGKEFTFTDNVTYTDKSGEPNTSQGATTLVVKAVNPYKDNGGGARPDSAGGQPPLVINNYTNEQNHENRVNIAIPGINTETDDKRIIVFWRSVDTPTKVKEVELTIDSDFDQKRSIEFYGTWNKNGAYAAWYAPDNLGTSNTFEVYTVNGTTETKLGEIAFKKNGGTSIDLPEGTTKVLLRPKGEMTFTNDTLSQAGIYLHQNLKGLEKAKQMVAEGKEAKSIVTAKVSTQDTDVVNTSISKTILADARTALKLTSRTGKIETVLAGNKTQLLSSGIEAYDYSPSGLGNRVYNTYTSHGATTDKKLEYLGTKNPKIIVELPDGFSYAGNSPLVTKDDNYQNTGKRVLIIDPKDSNTRENVTPDLEFNVAQWVQTGSYRLKYTLVWDENRFLHGLNPNNEFDGDKKIINTSTFTYEIPVSNTSGTRLHVDVTDKNDQREGYTTSLQNLAPKADVTYRFTLSNTDNSKLSNNEVLVTLPKKDDKNIVDTSIARNSAFDVEATGEAIAPAGWTAYYSTTPISGNANEVAKATTLTADQVTDWSKVTAVKFVSNPGTTLNPGLSNEFLVPARISKDAKDKQVAYISAAAKTNAEEIYNEANVASVTIKTENIKNGAVKIAYEDMQGNTIKPTITAIEKRAYTKDYNVDTEEYRPDEFTYNGIAYRYMRVKETSAPVEGVVNSEEITVTYVYDTLYENVPETKTITRTIKYVDASNETTEVSPKVVQNVTLTRTNKRNKVTNTLEEGTWTQGSWTEQASPTVANYGTPDKASVASVPVTPTMENEEVVVKYPQAKEDEVETKVITRTIKYVDASNETTEVSPKVVQTVTLTRTNKRNKVTNTLEEGTWTQGSWTEQASPTVANYGTPDKASVASVAVTPTMENTEVVVKYPQSKEDEVETKVITRTIKYVDASNETTEVSAKVVQTVTLIRTNKRNKVTNTLEEGTWTQGSWTEQASPTVENYGTPDKASVASVPVTPTMENEEVVVKYPQAKEDEVETKVITRTIKYVDASNETTEVSPKVVQTVTLTRTNKRNKVTNTLEEGTWTQGSWTEQASPTVANYGTPDKASVASVPVTPTMENEEVVVKYPQAKEDEVETKVITRTIKYVDASNETTEVSPKVVQTVTLTRTNKQNKVTNTLEEGTWTSGSWTEQASPTVANYGTPDKASVASVPVTPTMENEEVVVKYPQAKEDEVETKVITRTIKYVDASNETTEVSPKVVQTVTLTRTNKRNKVTNTLEEGTWTQGSWTEQASPTVANYGTPDKASVASVPVTPTMENEEVVVKYPQAKEDEVETKVITRTIKYVYASNETTEVSPKVVQTVTLTRTNKRNKVTNTLEEGTWTSGSWTEQASPTLAKYGTPDKTSVSSVVVTPTTENTEVVVKYPQAADTKTVATKQTVTYEGAGDKTPAPNEQTDYTFTGKTNKVTNVTTWNEETHTYGVVTTPKVEGYYADKAQAGGKKVTPTEPEASDKVVYKPLGKVILVDEGGNEIPNTPKPTYKNNPNDPTVGGETPIPEIPDGYEIKPKQDVPAFNPEGKVVTPSKPGEDTRIVLVKVNQKATVKYVVDGTNTVLHKDELEGKSGEPIQYTTEAKLAELKKLGYELVTDGFVTATDKNFDNDPRVDQDFLVTVAKTVPVTPTTPQNPNEDPKNPNPGDPIDPKNPDGPKWTKDALDKLNNIKTVTRTITYVKDGTDEEVSTTEAPKVTNKVSFTRTVVVNPKDGSVVGYDTTGDGIADVPATDTTSGWTAAGTAKFAEVKSPVVKGYVVKPNQDTQGDLVEADGSKVKASTTDLTVDSANQDLKVRYVPVGKLVPKVPEGETPPTPVTPTPYENVPGEPGKVVPPSPTKPTDPQDPNSPKVPVIPHIPGTTPKDPNGNPLKPVDPTDPTKGYVPPTPKTPTENTEINYEKDTQKAVTKFVDPSGNLIPGVNNIVETGNSGDPLTKATEVTTEIAKLIAKGYDLVSNNYGKDNNGNFDKDSGKDQEYTVVLTQHIQDVPPFDPTNPNDPNTPKPGEPIDPKNPDGPKWTKELIDKLNTTRHVTRTITYVEDGTDKEVADKATDKVTFTRTAKINVVTGTIEYGNWTSVNNDTTFDKVTSPVVPGYVLKDASQKEVAATENLTENSKDENIKVVYVPVGKLVPKVPEGVTPPTPTPYDNVPGEPGKVVPPSPTKPTDPQDPNSPKVPVIPHIPGTTPQVPKDPTKPVDPNTNPLVPLKPIDPKDPTKGYEVPPVPNDPTKDTPIEYVPNNPKDDEFKPKPPQPQPNPKPYPGPNPTPVPNPAPAPQPEPKPEPKPNPETPKPVTPADNGDNNGNNNGTPSNNGDHTPMRELPNTGTGNEFAIFGTAASAILAGLGLVVPGKKKEEEE